MNDMQLVLSLGKLSLPDDDLPRTVSLAARHGFDAVDPMSHRLMFAPHAELEEYAASARAHGLSLGVATFPVQPANLTNTEFDEILGRFTEFLPRLAEAGCCSWSLWIPPGHDDADANGWRNLLLQRIDALRRPLADVGGVLGLEYVGPATFRRQFQHPFVWTLSGLLDALETLPEHDGLGLILDSFHWYTAGETATDIADLRGLPIVAADLSDAVAGVDRESQLDGEREMPGDSGIIDLPGFIDVLRSHEFTGPVQAEPFSSRVIPDDLEDRVEAALVSLHRFTDPGSR